MVNVVVLPENFRNRNNHGHVTHYPEKAIERSNQTFFTKNEVVAYFVHEDEDAEVYIWSYGGTQNNGSEIRILHNAAN